MDNTIEGWDENLHKMLMASDSYYNKCWWDGREEFCLTIQQEFAAILSGPHG